MLKIHKYDHPDFSHEMNDNYYTITENYQEMSKNIDHTLTGVYADLDERSMERWMYWIHELEILFIERDEDTQLHSDISHESYNTLLARAENRTKAIGLHYYMMSKIRFSDNEEWKHLEGAEMMFRTGSQLFELFTTENNDFLICASSKQPTWSQITKLKLLQYALLKQRGYVINNLLIEFVTAFHTQDIEKINILIDAISDCEKYSTMKINNVMKIFKTQYTTQIDQLENLNSNNTKKILELENKITELASTIRKNFDTIELLKAKAEKGSDEIRMLERYLVKHPYIKDLTKNGSQVIMYYEAPLLYYHEYTIERIRRNQSDFGKKICDIFLERRYQLFTRCKLGFDPTTFYLQAYGGLGNSNKLVEHPHIDRYSCLGNHRAEVQNAALSGDYLTAIEQISQAVLNLNFTDSCVIRAMMRNLESNKDIPTWYDTETKTFISTNDIMERN